MNKAAKLRQQVYFEREINLCSRIICYKLIGFSIEMRDHTYEMNYVAMYTQHCNRINLP